MGTADAGRGGAATHDPATDAAAAPQLVRAAAALRWKRPDLTATLAEIALESAADPATWVTAAGWLLHGRAVLGDGRDTACDLLDGLDRWGETGVALMAGPAGRRMRVELAAPVRRIGEPGLARVLLSADPDLDDAELRADVLTELARCAVDDAPDTADDALRAADRAWRDAACPPGVASVALLSAARQRQAGHADVAISQVTDGLRGLGAGGKRAGATASDHVAAALTAEWIAALVEAGRLDEARDEAVPAANRLIAVARTGRQVAGLRLALARVTAAVESPDAVLTALEAAAQDAADSDAPELESACRSMLGELHETAGRLDAALGALRAAMAAERRDRDRGARLRTRVAAATASWTSEPSRGSATTSVGPAHRSPRRPDEGPTHTRDGDVPTHVAPDAAPDGPSPARSTTAWPAAADGPEAERAAPGRNGSTAHDDAATGRRARRLAAEARQADQGAHEQGAHEHGAHEHGAHEHGGHGRGLRDPGLRELGATTALWGGDAGRVDDRTYVGDAGRRGESGPTGHRGRGGHTADGGRTGEPSRHGAPPQHDAAPPDRWAGASNGSATNGARSNGAGSNGAGSNGSGSHGSGFHGSVPGGSLIGDALLREFAQNTAPSRSGEYLRRHDPAHERSDAFPPTGDDPLFGAVPDDPGRRPAPGHADDGPTVDSRTVRWDSSAARASRPPALDDTVVLDAAVGEAAGRPDGREPDPEHRPDTPRPPDPDGPADPAAPSAEPGPRAARRAASGREAGRPPSTDTDGLGLAELLAGALAAYRNL